MGLPVQPLSFLAMVATVLVGSIQVAVNGFPSASLSTSRQHSLQSLQTRQILLQLNAAPPKGASRRNGFPGKSFSNDRSQSRPPATSMDDFDDDDDDDDTFVNSWADFDNDSNWNERTAQPSDKEQQDLQQQKSHFFSQKSLADPSFRSSKGGHNSTILFQKLCQGAGITKPSKIQSLAWPVLQQGKNVIIADQTGSGKTLAYLIPLIQRAIEAKATLLAQSPSKTAAKKLLHGAPHVIVLAPTAELADQTRAVCDKIAQVVPFSTLVVTATGKYSTSIRDQIRLLERQPVDVLISTPGRLATILRTRNAGGLDLTRLQAIVLDEVDVLLVDETFGPQLRTVGAAAPIQQVQFVFCTATLPDSVVETVQKEFPNVQVLKGPGLHRVALTVKERLIDVSVPSALNQDAALCFDIKAQELLKALRQTRCRRTLIFCNTVESCRQVENLLKRKDRRENIFRVMSYHSAMTPEARHENLDAFARNNNNEMDSVLVCTDRAARGVDFDAAPVDHVILFDFPKDPAEYVRRVGRTARAGRTGTSTVFAYGWQLPIARSIMGSKLESYSVGSSENADGEDPEFRGGVKGRRRKQEKDHSIRTNIEGGKLWTKKD